MFKLVLVVCVVIFSFSLMSCAKKENVMQAQQEPVPMEVLTAIANNTAGVVQEPTLPADPSMQTMLSQKAQEPMLPPQGPYKPSIKEIQGALKNAGYYSGAIDGKAGPMTKKAIEEFQKANSLQPDGKVGPKTWAALGRYVTASESTGI